MEEKNVKNGSGRRKVDTRQMKKNHERIQFMEVGKSISQYMKEKEL